MSDPRTSCGSQTELWLGFSSPPKFGFNDHSLGCGRGAKVRFRWGILQGRRMEDAQLALGGESRGSPRTDRNVARWIIDQALPQSLPGADECCVPPKAAAAKKVRKPTSGPRSKSQRMKNFHLTHFDKTVSVQTCHGVCSVCFSAGEAVQHGLASLIQLEHYSVVPYAGSVLLTTDAGGGLAAGLGESGAPLSTSALHAIGPPHLWILEANRHRQYFRITAKRSSCAPGGKQSENRRRIRSVRRSAGWRYTCRQAARS